MEEDGSAARKKGEHGYAVTLTGMDDRVHPQNIGVETAIQGVVYAIKYSDLDDFVLVGHSLAGKVAAAVDDRVPDRVKMVAYLDAARPEKAGAPQPSSNPTARLGPLPSEGCTPGGIACRHKIPITIQAEIFSIPFNT